MKRFLIFLGIVFLIFTWADQTSAQYWGEMVLEKSFEKENFFFTPNELTPFGLASFASVAPGLFSNPILEFALNPAGDWQYAPRDFYIYADLRSIHNVQSNAYGVVPLYDYGATRSVYPYPIYFSQPHSETLPFFAGAIFWRPLKIFGRKPILGATYRMIFQDEDYYAIPFDIYRSSIGVDYSGARYLNEDVMPTIDRYRGEDNISRTGHFASIFASYELIPDLALGARINRTTFDRNGKFGSHNFFNDNSNPSLWENWEWRDQNYTHWDYSAGLKFKVNKNFVIGGKYGFLDGNAVQNLGTEDSSFFAYGQKNQNDNWATYNSSGASDKNWQHEGETRYQGVDFRLKFSRTLSTVVYFLREKSNVDLYLKANISDSSSGASHYNWSENIYDSEFSYSLTDNRHGTGWQSKERNLFAALFKWRMEKRKTLSFGVQVELADQKTETNETVFSRRFSHNVYSNTNPDYSDGEYLYSVTESKHLQWDFRARRKDIRIPIVFEWKISRSMELLLGVNRTMSRWTIDDVTLAKFDYRISTDNSKTERKENFAERYIEPQEKRTNIATTMMAGFTFYPTKDLRVQLLGVPVFEDRYTGSELSHFEVWLNLDVWR